MTSWSAFAVLLALVAVGFVHAAGGHHTAVLPDEIEWKPFVGTATMAVLSGDPDKAGAPFVLRIKHPAGMRVPPHWHPIDEHITVLTGTFRVGTGERIDESKTTAIPVGGYVHVPAKMAHFAIAEGEVIAQIHGIGPFTTTFVNPADDPRAQKK